MARKARDMKNYKVRLTYEAVVIMRSDAEPTDPNWERDLALEAEQYVSPVMDLTDWKISPASSIDDQSVANV